MRMMNKVSSSKSDVDKLPYSYKVEAIKAYAQEFDGWTSLEIPEISCAFKESMLIHFRQIQVQTV